MLVLSRKVGEVIYIGEDVTVMVVAIEGRKIRLGITAPRDVPINRGELGKSPDGQPKPQPKEQA